MKALKIQQLVEKGWYNESVETIILNCSEFFTRGLPKKITDFAHNRQIKQASTALELFCRFNTLVKHVDAEDIRNGKIRNLDLPLEIKIVTSKRESQNLSSETYDPNPEIMFI